MAFLNWSLTDRTGQTMGNKLFSIFLFFGFVAMAKAGPHIGFVDVKDGKMYLHTDARRTEIDVVYLQYPGRRNRCCLRITRPKIASENAVLAESDKVSSDNPIYAYAIAVPPHVPLGKPFLGMALVNVNRPVFARGLEMSASADGKVFKVRQCFGMEGLNLEVSGTPSSVASMYYSFGYEIDLTALANDKRCK